MTRKPPNYPHPALDIKSANDIKKWLKKSGPARVKYIQSKGGDAARAKKVKVTLPKLNFLASDEGES